MAAGGAPVHELRVDGGACVNDLLMQFQADLLGIPVVRPAVIETTALGAAYLAGLAVGVYRDADELAAQWQVRARVPADDVARPCPGADGRLGAGGAADGGDLKSAPRTRNSSACPSAPGAAMIAVALLPRQRQLHAARAAARDRCALRAEAGAAHGRGAQAARVPQAQPERPDPGAGGWRSGAVRDRRHLHAPGRHAPRRGAGAAAGHGRAGALLQVDGLADQHAAGHADALLLSRAPGRRRRQRGGAAGQGPMRRPRSVAHAGAAGRAAGRRTAATGCWASATARSTPTPSCCAAGRAASTTGRRAAMRHIAPYLQRMLARPAVQRVFEAEGLALPYV